MPSNHLIHYYPLFLPPSNFPSIKVFSHEFTLNIRWLSKYWSFSFSISPSNEYSGLISFGTDWFDLLAVQGTLKSLLQHHSSNASILRHSAFFIVQLTSIHDYFSTYKYIIKKMYIYLILHLITPYNTVCSRDHGFKNTFNECCYFN